MSCAPGCAVCEQLRDAALELVGEAGLERVSLRAIATRSGLLEQDATEHYESAAACVYDTYDEVSASIALDMAGAFSQGTSWASGFALARQRMLTRVATRPAEARLCFVEVLRGDPELRMRRVQTRRWIVEYLSREYERRRNTEPLPDVQIELLIGAGFQAVSHAVYSARNDADLTRRLAELADGLEALASSLAAA